MHVLALLCVSHAQIILQHCFLDFLYPYNLHIIRPCLSHENQKYPNGALLGKMAFWDLPSINICDFKRHTHPGTHEDMTKIKNTWERVFCCLNWHAMTIIKFKHCNQQGLNYFIIQFSSF